ncbi:ferritin-like domain-containing protein [Sporosarcina thermotolerans]|uniref:Ferritin-like domain-containing protein n=1 Tax=Sporosarcina thermotolerans TaxID=633404 RepID=A0AAW9A8Z1_9BACL|nr:ferritin-like domain-containing protein [Sporosarcina thermotolerans]MDW0117519.1 ferritin-like domain-containing protein [Sporosarcina thermotolerans]
MNQSSMQTSTSTEVLNEILKAIDGEYTAIACYELLANQAPNDEMKKRILEIRNDEIRHYTTFWYLYISLTGKQPSPKMTRQCPSDFKSGVLAAFKDEQETVDFYHEVARSTDNPIVRDAFTHASADQQNHAVWFLYFLNNL